MTQQTLTRTDEKRREQRYLCLGIGKVYSALAGRNISGLGQLLHHAALSDASLSGLSFDVNSALAAGQKIYLLIDQPDGASHERLVCDVRRCEKISDTVYRIGVSIDTAELVRVTMDGKDSLGVGRAMPVGAELVCPSCGSHANFNLAGYQKTGKDTDTMPLYDCGACGTSRTIIGVLACSRQNLAAGQVSIQPQFRNQ